MDKNFKRDVQYRLARIGKTQKDIAERMCITEPYLYYLLKGISDTQLAQAKREKIVAILEEFESECENVGW